jgi:hypothetical protein
VVELVLRRDDIRLNDISTLPVKNLCSRIIRVGHYEFNLPISRGGKHMLELQCLRLAHICPATAPPQTPPQAAVQLQFNLQQSDLHYRKCHDYDKF